MTTPTDIEIPAPLREKQAELDRRDDDLRAAWKQHGLDAKELEASLLSLSPIQEGDLVQARYNKSGEYFNVPTQPLRLAKVQRVGINNSHHVPEGHVRFLYEVSWPTQAGWSARTVYARDLQPEVAP